VSQILADKLLALAGPGRILHYGCSDAALVRALLARGCDAYGRIVADGMPTPMLDGRISWPEAPNVPATFDTVVVDQSIIVGAADIRLQLQSLRKHAARTLVLDFSGVSPLTKPAHLPTNSQIEDAAVAAGFRRHPATFPVGRYARLNDPAPEALLCFEKIPDEILARWPMEFLLANRDLHMDMSREASPRADAHMVRYALAAEWIRPGDTVLDCACGLGYGAALLAAASRGRRIIGIDLDVESIAYARDNFGGYSVEYRAGSALDLGFLPNRSVDMVVTFETIEHLQDYDRFLDEIARILKPDGRVIGSVPHLWVDETGRDPNPHHFHAFDYAQIRDALSRHFIVEARYAQTAPGGVKLLDAPRRLEQRPLQAAPVEEDTEWWILVAAADPSGAAAGGYQQPEFDPCVEGTHSHLTGFASHYDNPWIYRQLIQNGQRIRDTATLAETIATAVKGARRNSADLGAMLTVLSYQALQDHDDRQRAHLLAEIEAYLELDSDNPHVYRWRISLAYVAALLALDGGQREQGKAFLKKVLSLDPLRFSPLISTKTVGGYFLLGTMALVDGDTEDARAAFAEGVAAARRALHAPDENAIGRPDHPLAFGFFELAEIADMAGQCAMALNEIDAFGHAPGRFWRSVDVKRFGLLTWIRNIEAEYRSIEAEYAGELAQLHAECTLRKLLPLRLKELVLVLTPSLTRRIWASLTAATVRLGLRRCAGRQ